MGVTNYIRLGSEIIGERPLGGTRRNYARDALGSVTGTLSGGAVENTYAFKPYGAQLAKTGSASDPSFTWAGIKGYCATARAGSDYYVRARHYGSAASRWASRDPAWPYESPGVYCSSMPTTSTDMTGLGPCPNSIELLCRATTNSYQEANECCAEWILKHPSYARKHGFLWTPPNPTGEAPRDCQTWFKRRWRVAREGCVQVCERLLCDQLSDVSEGGGGKVAEEACDRWCEDQCDNTTKAGSPPTWAICGVYPTDISVTPNCGDCCHKYCRGDGLCMDHCVTNCCEAVA